ncbi:MAG: hypothetical protein NVS4B13_01090 [Candidatus Elarobacter sp.]
MRIPLFPMRVVIGALLMAAGVASTAVAQVTTTPDTSRRTAPTTRPVDSVHTAVAVPAIVPQLDQARGVDAEIRIALDEMYVGRTIPAVSRLAWLNASPVALTPTATASVFRGREDLLFLLAEGYYRLGLDSAFRSVADPLTSTNAGAGRYARVLQQQLLLAAYRTGDYARVAALAKGVDSTGGRGLGALITGLAAYQTRDFPGARAAFAVAQQGTSAYAQYAAYMDALTSLRGDTTQTAAALAALRAIAERATGEFADQVRLTAAQVAYESDKYDDAADLSGRIAPTSGLAAQALLTQAWALYKARHIDQAGVAFAQFATRFAAMPERDESRLMSGQALLQLGRTSEASRVFHTVSDSAAAESNELQSRARPAMTTAARALVAARTAGLLFVSNTETGKTIALQDSSGAESAVLAAAFADPTQVVTPPAVAPTELVSTTQYVARLNEAGASVAAIPRRVFFTPVSATRNRADYAQRARSLYAADVEVAIARERLQEGLDAQMRQIALLRALRQQLTAAGDTLGMIGARTTAARDSLNRMVALLDAAGVRLGQLIRAQLSTTRLLADENARGIDSVRTALGLGAGTDEALALSTESRTAGAYRRIADLVERGVDSTIAHHPAFALRDAVRKHGERVGQMLAQAEEAHRNALALVASELARLEGGDNEAVRGLRGTLASAESRRQAVESQVVAIVDAELNARAGELVASLRRDTEAAQFGAASAAFFQALDAGGTRPGAAGTTGATGSAGGSGAALGAPESTPSIQLQQK